MSRFREKQRKMKKLRNAFVIISAVVILIYIAVEPALLKQLGAVTPFQLGLFALVLVTLAVVFIYESKYAKAEAYLDDNDYKISDAGYYFTARCEKTLDEYVDAVYSDLADNGYKIAKEQEIFELHFDVVAVKPKEFFYAVKLDATDSNDVTAYVDAAVNDITANRMKRKGEGVVLFICNKADESAIALSKNYTRLITGARRNGNNVTVYPAIAELSSGRVYFLGNYVSRAQKMIVNYAMNCDLPIKEQYIGKERLLFQTALKEKMKDFDGKAF